MHRKSMEAAHSLSSEVLQEREEEDGRGSRGTDTIEVARAERPDLLISSSPYLLISPHPPPPDLLPPCRWTTGSPSWRPPTARSPGCIRRIRRSSGAAASRRSGRRHR